MVYHDVEIIIVWNHLFLIYNKISLIAFASSINKKAYNVLQFM